MSDSVNSAQQSSYRGIFKATSLFGGVQLWKILIEIAKQKIIALLLGPSGMGILGLYDSAVNFIQGLTAMGLSTSAVKNVAESNASHDELRMSQTIIALKRLVWATGLLGTAVFAVLSPLLSKISFGNYDYTIPFAILSVTLLLKQLSSGQLVVLQGLRKLKDLARAGVYGAFWGLVASVPLYYLFRLDGIVPSLIIYSAVTLFLSWWYTRKIEIEEVHQTAKETLKEGKEMLMMGIVMSVNSMLVLGVGYAIRAFISHTAGIADVGFFTAGFSMVNGYVGMIFSAMTTDFYPRLASVNKDNSQCREVVNQQIEIATIILIPLVVLFIMAAPLMILVLFSEDFLTIVWYMRIAMIGIPFKAASWAISYQFIAKQDMNSFIICEIVGNVISLLSSIIAYHFYGINGLGAAFVVTYVLFTILVYYVSNRNYQYSFSSSLIVLIVKGLVLVLLTFIVFLFGSSWIYYSIAFFILIISSIIAFKELNKRIELTAQLKRLKR